MGPVVPLVDHIPYPPLPFPGDSGSITGWSIDQSVSISSSSLVNQVETGFAGLSHNIPSDSTDPDCNIAIRELVDEVVNSDDLSCYLTVSETGTAASHVVLVVHFIGKCSTGFGVLSMFQRNIIFFVGETI
jgi:hypothetical protein